MKNGRKAIVFEKIIMNVLKLSQQC